jgi:hypothetical protein
MTDTAEAAFVGYAPQLKIDGPTPQPGHTDWKGEQTKYEEMWKHPEYRQVAPGESIASVFLEQARPKQGAEVIDFGTGTGRGALVLAAIGGLKVRMLDFAENCLDDDVRQIVAAQPHAMCFAKQDLTHPIPWSAEYGFCTDVMEHIPPEQVDAVLTNVLKASQHVFFQISCVDDVCGALIGQPLHLSVHDYSWWLKKLRDDFNCTISYSKDGGSYCLFYVTAWWTGKQMVDIGVLNTEQQVVLDNVRKNAQRKDIQQIKPAAVNDVDVLILGGGPSLKSSAAEIRELREAGARIVTLNGAYNWALEQGFQVGAQIVVDARAHNLRFVQPIQDNCKYFLASQVNPSLYDACPPDRTYQWHTTAEMIREILDEHVPEWFGIPGGSTVLLRAIPLLRMIGFKRFHLFGCDSCCMENEHHAYAQAENDGQLIIDTIVGGRTFKCVPFHISQAQEFMDLIRVFGDEVDIEIHGDGLLAWIMQHAANLDQMREQLSPASLA